MVLLSGELGTLATGARLARRTLNIIRQNLAWAAGYNLLALDSSEIFLRQKDQGEAFNLLSHVRSLNELLRVRVRKPRFPWVERNIRLTRRNPEAVRAGIAGYEVALDFNGVPFELTPLAAGAFSSDAPYELIRVNETEHKARPCRKLLRKTGGRWTLTKSGERLLELILQTP